MFIAKNIFFYSEILFRQETKTGQFKHWKQQTKTKNKKNT